MNNRVPLLFNAFFAILNAIMIVCAVTAVTDFMSPSDWYVMTSRGSVHAIEHAIDRGQDVNAVSEWHFKTALHIAALNGRIAVCNIIIEHGGLPDPRDENGRTPLHYASLNAHADCVRILLQAGADPSVLDGLGGFTPLRYAVRGGHYEVQEVLLDSRRISGDDIQTCREDAEQLEDERSLALLMRASDFHGRAH